METTIEIAINCLKSIKRLSNLCLDCRWKINRLAVKRILLYILFTHRLCYYNDEQWIFIMLIQC